jgi:hypothetical protein
MSKATTKWDNNPNRKPKSNKPKRYKESEVDIATVVEQLRPHGIWQRSALTYGSVWKSWDDPRPCPTWDEIEDAWEIEAAKRATEPTPEEEEALHRKISYKMRDMAIDILVSEGEMTPEEGEFMKQY